MSISLQERAIGGDGLFSLTKRRFDLKPLSQDVLTGVFERVISSGKVSELGQELLVDCKELLWLRDAPNVLVASSLEEARDNVGLLLTEIPGRIGYITGGMEGLHLQILLNGLAATEVETFIIGVEEDSYSIAKGRKPPYSMEEKVSLWEQLAPDRSVLFVVPQRPEFVSPDNYHDWIAKYLGLFGNEQIVYLGSKDDSQEVVLAHQRRAASPRHCLNLSLGNPPIHTSELPVK